MEGLDLEVTEFGQRDHDVAPDFFWRNYCAMAASDISRAVWYPLTQRGDNYPPVLLDDMSLTPMGNAFTYAHKSLQGKPVEFMKLDPFTYACVFNGQDAVVWGEPRPFTLNRGDIEPRRGDMREFDRPLDIMRDRVVLLHSDGEPINLETDISFGTQGIIADSYHQFFRPAEGENARTAEGIEGFRRYLLVGKDDQIVDLHMCPGQQTNGVPWRPYLCQSTIGNLWNFAWLPNGFNIVGGEEEKMRVVLEHISEKDQTMYVDTDIALSLFNVDGVTVEIIVAGEERVSTIITGTNQSRFGPYEVAEGQEVKIIIGGSVMNQMYNGDFRVTLVDANCNCGLE